MDELLAAHASSEDTNARRQFEAALSDLASFVEDSDAEYLNVFIAAAARNETSAFATPEGQARVRQLIDRVTFRQSWYLSRAGVPDTTARLSKVLDAASSAQYDEIKRSIGGTCTFSWLAFCGFKVLTADALSSGLPFLAFAIGGAFVAPVVLGFVFYAFHRRVLLRVLMRVRPAPSTAWAIGRAQFLGQILVVIVVATLLFDRIFYRAT